MNIHAMLDEPVVTDQTALAIRKIESALAEFERITAGLAELKTAYPPDVVYDVSSTKGMSEAIAHRAAWRDPRVMVEKYRKLAKAPVLTIGRDIDARAVWITEQLLLGETPIDAQIKVEERRKEDEKQARINAEFGRVQAIQEALAAIHMDAMAVSNKDSGVITERIEAMRAQKLDPLVFQEMIEQAKQAQASAIAKLEVALKAQLYSESEAAKLADERAELAELRSQQAAQKKRDQEAAARARAADDARLQEQRLAMAEQQRKLDAQEAELKRRMSAAPALETGASVGYAAPPGEDTADELRDVLIRNGFVRCDIPACNCGSWHARYGLKERMDNLRAERDEAIDSMNSSLRMVADLRQALVDHANANMDEPVTETKADRAARAAPPAAHTDHPTRHYDRTCPACVADDPDAMHQAFDALWPTLPIPGEFDAMDACDRARWRGAIEAAFLAGAKLADRAARAAPPDPETTFDHMQSEEAPRRD